MTIIRPTTINARFSQPVGIGGEKLWLCPTLAGDRLDLSGNGNHGTYNGGTGTVGDKYKGSRAYEFDGTNYINCGSASEIHSNSVFSYSIWLKGQTTSLGTTVGVIGAYDHTTGDRGALFAVGTNFGYRGGFYYQSVGSTYNASELLRLNYAVVVDQTWHHVACVFDGLNGEARIYRDGLLKEATSVNVPSAVNQSTDFLIGRGAAQNFRGSLDDARVFDRALTPSEIKHLASKRGVLGSPRQLYDPLKRTVVRVPAAIPAATKVGSIKKPKTIIKPSYQAGYARNASESENPKLWDGLVGAWMPSLGVTGETLRDVSGNGNHGTLTNMDPASDWVGTSKGLALDFDGTNDYITMGDAASLKLPNSFTLECWAKTEGVSGVRTIAGNINTTTTRCNYRIALTNGNALAVGQFTSGGSFKNTSIAGPVNNTWNHYAVTWDKTNLVIYLNTVSSSANYSGFTPDTSSTNFYVGRFTSSIGGANDLWNGRQASLKAYNRALSPTEIKQLYVDSLAPFRKKQRVSVAVPGAVTPTTAYHPLRSLAHPLEQ